MVKNPMWKILCLVVFLTACATGQGGPTPKAVVLAGQQSLTTGNQLILAYYSLPVCTPATAPVCHDPAFKPGAKLLSLRAYNALVAAQSAVNLDPDASSTTTRAAMADAQAALAGLNAYTATLPVTR